MVCKNPDCKRCKFAKRKIESLCESMKIHRQCNNCRYQYKDFETEEPCQSCAGYINWETDLNGTVKD